MLAGREVAPKLLVLTLPHPDARFCAAGMSERSECLYEGLAGIFAQIGRAPTALVLDNATEAGRRAAGVVTESELFSRFRAHYRCSSRYCNPYSGHEKRVRRERRGLPGEEPAGPGARGARDEGRLDRELAQVGRAALLVVDELGFPPLDPDGARLLFQVVSEAYERQSVVVTTNLEFSRWGQVSGDDQMAAAVIDRVVHHGRLLQFRGESYRVRHALMQQA